MLLFSEIICSVSAFHGAVYVTVLFSLFVFTFGKVNMSSVPCLMLDSCLNCLKEKPSYSVLGSLVTECNNLIYIYIKIKQRPKSTFVLYF